MGLPLTKMLWVISALPLLMDATSARPSSDAMAVCTILEIQYPKQVAFSGDGAEDVKPDPYARVVPYVRLGLEYNQARDDYWSQASVDNKPACIFFPLFPEDVSFAVVLLQNYTDVSWAVKGGGYNPNVGYSSTKDGVLISFEQKMVYVEVANVTGFTHVLPGARWSDVATISGPYGKAVATGHFGHSGVAGHSLGGGLSFLSMEHGLTADTIAEYEFVTADGKIRTVNRHENSDLFYALKGGGNQFAIVTQFAYDTFDIGLVWGGYKIYTMDKRAALLKATHNLVSNYYDTKAGVIVTFTTAFEDLADVFIVFYYYDSRGPKSFAAKPGIILDDFNAIPALKDNTKSQEYHELIDANSRMLRKGMRNLVRTGTIPNLPGAQGIDVLDYAFDSYLNISLQHQGTDHLVFSLAYQPFPHQLANASVNAPNGVNLLGLDPAYGDKILMEYDVSWQLPSSDVVAAEALTHATQPVQDYTRSHYHNVKPTNWQKGEVWRDVDVGFTSYKPLFMNNAMFSQDPLRSYGQTTYDKLRKIQKERDPKGFFLRTGGFKFDSRYA